MLNAASFLNVIKCRILAYHQTLHYSLIYCTLRSEVMLASLGRCLYVRETETVIFVHAWQIACCFFCSGDRERSVCIFKAKPNCSRDIFIGARHTSTTTLNRWYCMPLAPFSHFMGFAILLTLQVTCCCHHFSLIDVLNRFYFNLQFKPLSRPNWQTSAMRKLNLK